MDLSKLIVNHDSNSLNRKIKRLLERVETEKFRSDDEFNKLLSNIQSSLETAKRLNTTYFNNHRIPVENYEMRLNVVKSVGMCYDTLDW